MNLIEPNYKILKAFGEKDPLAKIGRCIRSLQGSKEEPGRNAVLSLLQEHTQKEQEQLLELGNLVFDIRLDSESPMIKFFERQPSCLNIDRIEKKRYLLSGSIRALRDLCRAHKDLKIVKALLGCLLKDYQSLFIDIITRYRAGTIEGVIVDYMADRELKELSLELKIKHLYLAAHFQASLHAVYELITGCRISAHVLQKPASGDRRELCFVKPLDCWPDSTTYQIWIQGMKEAEKAFLALASSAGADKAQTMLPLALKTDLVINTSLLEWMQIFKFGLRQDTGSEIQGLILSLFKDMKQIFPDVFENIVVPGDIQKA